MKQTTLSWLVQLLVWAAFVFVALGMVFARGVCCADDSFHAHVAKNIANGLGFASTITLGEVFSVRLFDPLLGTGPTIMLPAALVIRLFGNTYWAPGVAVVGLWATILLAIGFVLNRSFANPNGKIIAVITVFSFFYLFFVFHFEQWYALLGDNPAALLVVLAVFVYFERDSKLNLFLVGVCFSLATLSKIVSVLLFCAFLLFVFILQVVRYKNNWKRLFSAAAEMLSFTLAGFLIPFVLYELWKVSVLGFPEYIQNWSRHIQYISNSGVTQSASILTTMIERVGVINDRFGLFLPVVFVIFLGAGYALRKEKKLFMIFLALSYLTTVFTLYWIFLSRGWARYYIHALIMIIFLLAIPFLSSRLRTPWKVVYSLMIVFLSLYASQNYDITYPFMNIRLFQPDNNVLALYEMNSMLEAQEDSRPFLTQWWATAADIEYIMHKSSNFTIAQDPNFQFDQPFVMAVNSRLYSETDDFINGLFETCDVREVGIYVYAECPPQSNP